MIDGAAFFNEAQTENEFMRNVIAYARMGGFLVYHTHIAKRSAEGFPDLVLVRDGRLVFAELKREKPANITPGRAKKYDPTPAQSRWLKRLCVVGNAAQHQRGGELRRPVEAFLWRPSDWDQIMKVLA